MSVQALGWVLDHSPTTGSDRLVLISIANHAGSTQVPDKVTGDYAWEAYPGVHTIAREAGLERIRTAQDALTRLAKAKHITRTINGAPDERIRKDLRPNLYRILLDNGVPCSDARCKWCGVSPERSRGDAPASNGVSESDAAGCRNPTPKPSVEPSGEPVVQPALTLVVGDGATEADPFETFWNACRPGRRPSKNGDGIKAWRAAIKLAKPEVIIEGMRRYVAETADREATYVKTPAVWLRARGWEDEPGTHASARPKRPSRPLAPRHPGGQGLGGKVEL